METTVYLLFLANGDIYKGLTADLPRRLEEHRLGKVQSTRPYRPLHLLGYEVYTQHSDAERRERFLKTTEGRRLLQQQYRDALQVYTTNHLGNVENIGRDARVAESARLESE